MRGAVFFSGMSQIRISWPLAFVLACAIIAILVFTIFQQMASWPSRFFDALTHESASQVEKVRNVLADSFQLHPRISVKDHVVYEQSQNVLELTVLTKDTEVTREADQTWLGSTKHIRIRATFRLHAGFDLEKKCEVTVQGPIVLVKLPRAKILSTEVLGWNVEQLQDGLWNKIQPEDVQAELKALPELAAAKEPNLPEEAQQNFEKQLQEKLAPLGYKVRAEYEQSELH
jgi:lipopolysaccharide export LptBFGC system permease protein LptF